MLRIPGLFIFLFTSFTLFAQQDAFIQNGNALIHFKTFGTGKPILIINGGPGMNSDGFDGLAKKLSKDHMTITYDQRGTGRSLLDKIDKSTISMDLMINDIEVLRKYLKIDHWIILGHSFGGMLASYYATIHPENIEALILSSSGGIDLGILEYINTNIHAKLSARESDSLEFWNNKITGGDSSYHARLQRGMALASAYVYNKKFIPVIAERLTQGNNIINGLVWEDLQKMKFNCTDKLAGFNKPVLIIQGKNDILEEKTAILENKVYKNSNLVYLDHTGHYGWLDNEETYFKVIGHFLSVN